MDEPIAERTEQQPGPFVGQPVEPAAEPSPGPDAAAPAAPPATQIDGLEPGMTIVRYVRGPRRWPGIVACVLAVLMLAATAAGIQIASTRDYSTSTTLAYVAIALSAAAVILGLIAIFGRWARGAGIVGVVVAVLGNPLVLVYVLNSLSGQ